LPVIDRSLNYGRDVIESFYRRVAPFQSVLDIGAGGGDDLLAARKICPSAELFAVESFHPNVKRLQSAGIHTIAANLESAPLPFNEGSFDIALSNQTLEHVKEIFWILHEVSRVLKVGGSDGRSAEYGLLA
jgi:ubiquinone/menaquinone biosynthesis C-methylase UbiE